jgi:hypothetical protein
MYKRTLKLVLAASVLAGSFVVGASPRSASAATLCPPICCDAACWSVRNCFYSSGRCICSAYCTIGPQGDGLD